MQKGSFFKAAAVAVTVVLSQGALAADGTVNFTGEIVDTLCSIAPSSQNLTVPLGKVSRTVFDGATAGTAVVGKKATPARFNIDLLGCGATAKGATVTFSGTADLDDASNLRLANAGQVGVGAASGVAIELGDSAGTKLPLGSPSAVYILGQGDNALKFQAAYVATRSAVTAGPANSVAQFTIAYK
ncbi:MULTISPECIES: fimbrial protein [Variovorax]|uniref:Fimbrial protein n=1 Tax=Variovorax boronicumulans TaxID=436515 RepID=A0A250DDP5_9BURK|nr:fimbrial protein [Variovorax boronicumulans]ATA52374.1 fimbrial protein [Variovorax boronicumulans]MDP9913552.1 major type 1 subunit fimbrin (pilin) [Variovorax boronicumulans]